MGIHFFVISPCDFPIHFFSFMMLFLVLCVAKMSERYLHSTAVFVRRQAPAVKIKSHPHHGSFLWHFVVLYLSNKLRERIYRGEEERTIRYSMLYLWI